MIEMWNQHPGYFVVLAMIGLAIFSIISFLMLRAREYRHKERTQFIAKGPGPELELFFSGKLLRYIPWQFWTSLIVLLIITFSYFTSSIFGYSEGATTLLELMKYVTGAVLGSLFGKDSKNNV